MKPPKTCVHPDGRFAVGIHSPEFTTDNFRENSDTDTLGRLPDQTAVKNQTNFPEGEIRVNGADRIYEIANAFPFRGVTFINSSWADQKARKPETIRLAPKSACSLMDNLAQWQEKCGTKKAELPPVLALLPRPLQLALAQASTDPRELCALAAQSCDFVFDNGPDSPPTGIAFKADDQGRTVPVIHDHDLYDIIGNNPCLPDSYKEVMVLKPGIQGKSPIIGEACNDTHVFEYMRANSYIPWGHYAANMANDEIRYQAKALTSADMAGIRHLYYQRIYTRTARMLKIPLPARGRALTVEELEALRHAVTKALADGASKNGNQDLHFNAALWGWNFGFGFAQSGHRLHASHQMIHQQNAMIPVAIQDNSGNDYTCFSCGDLITDFINAYKNAHGKTFFKAFIKAVKNNQRTDLNPKGPASLVVWENNEVMLFAPKAQVSEWELMLITKGPCPHILAADTATRTALDTGIRIAVQTLEALGANLITNVEFGGRFTSRDTDQHLIYSFIPRLPYAPGTFSEAQMRFISGCFPEDFAQACRQAADPFIR